MNQKNQHQTHNFSKKQTGFTLMELIAAIAVAAIGIIGVLALFGTANSSQNASELLKNTIAIRAAVQQLYMGQGGNGYGTANLNQILITSKKLPSTMSTSGTTINTAIGGTLTVTGNTSNFKVAITDVPTDVCTQLITGSSAGWSAVQIGASTITTFPVSPAIASSSSNCGGTEPFTITWTSTN